MVQLYFQEYVISIHVQIHLHTHTHTHTHTTFLCYMHRIKRHRLAPPTRILAPPTRLVPPRCIPWRRISKSHLGAEGAVQTLGSVVRHLRCPWCQWKALLTVLPCSRASQSFKGLYTVFWIMFMFKPGLWTMYFCLSQVCITRGER